ncbi:MAG: B12-binding domain-containing radical SAM protein [Clostridiales bacterium]|nr:B12-binding domain-containing radical SAM protein [Clostridiales bacterium]
MRILLISPWDKRSRRYRSPLSALISYPPLTLPTLAALVPEELGAEIVVYDEISDKKLPTGPFDIVGVTVIAPESARAYELADYYRGLGSFTVLGGYHATFMQEEALTHADAIVTGEGLAAWPALLRDFASGAPVRRVYSDEGKAPAKRPVPRRGILTSRAYAPVDTMLVSNWCPNECSFCSISKMGRRSLRPVDDVIAELRGLKRRSVIFYDPNFFSDRPYALGLMKAMEPLHLRWGATATIGFGFDEELLEAARKAGCNGVLIGFESLDASAIKNANKEFCDPASYRRAVENIHRHHMTVNGTFVLGLDGETEESLAALPDRIRDIGIDLPIYFTLTPTPGNALYHEMKAQGRILTDDWSRYTQADVVFQPQNITPERLLVLYRRAWSRTYSFRSILQRVFHSPGASLYHKVFVLCMNIGFKFIGRDREQLR